MRVAAVIVAILRRLIRLFYGRGDEPMTNEVSDEAPAHNGTSARARREADPTCLRCGYSLIGLDPRRPCPECGLLAGLSVESSHELRRNRPRWLASLTAGAALVAFGAV